MDSKRVELGIQIERHAAEGVSHYFLRSNKEPEKCFPPTGCFAVRQPIPDSVPAGLYKVNYSCDHYRRELRAPVNVQSGMILCVEVPALGAENHSETSEADSQGASKPADRAGLELLGGLGGIGELELLPARVEAQRRMLAVQVHSAEKKAVREAVELEDYALLSQNLRAALAEAFEQQARVMEHGTRQARQSMTLADDYQQRSLANIDVLQQALKRSATPPDYTPALVALASGVRDAVVAGFQYLGTGGRAQAGVAQAGLKDASAPPEPELPKTGPSDEPSTALVPTTQNTSKTTTEEARPEAPVPSVPPSERPKTSESKPPSTGRVFFAAEPQTSPFVLFIGPLPDDGPTRALVDSLTEGKRVLSVSSMVRRRENLFIQLESEEDGWSMIEEWNQKKPPGCRTRVEWKRGTWLPKHARRQAETQSPPAKVVDKPPKIAPQPASRAESPPKKQSVPSGSALELLANCLAVDELTGQKEATGTAADVPLVPMVSVDVIERVRSQLSPEQARALLKNPEMLQLLIAAAMNPTVWQTVFGGSRD